MSRAPSAGPRSIEQRIAAGARLALLGVAAASLALLLYAVNRYRTELDAKALLAYGVSLGGIAFGTWAARRPGTQRIALALVSLTTAGSLLAAEAAIAWLHQRAYLGTQQAVEAFTGIPLDRRSIPEVVRALWREDSMAMPAIVPGVLMAYADSLADPRTRFQAPFLPLAGVSRRRSVQLCNEDGRYPIFESDEHGFLNPPGSWVPEQRGLVLIGDSFVHGYCVPTDSTLAGPLRARWDRTLNLGTGGSGPLAELGTLEEFGLPVHPKVVAWFYFENDLDDLRIEREHPVLSRYLDPAFSQRLISRQAEVDSALDPWVRRVYGGSLAPRSFEEHGLRRLLTLSTIRTLIGAARTVPSDPRAELPLLRQVLESARSRTTAAGARLVIVFLPSWERYYAPAANAALDAREDLRTIAAALSVPFIDLTPVFDAAVDKELLFARREVSTAHYSARGYQVAGAIVARGLDSLALGALLDKK